MKWFKKILSKLVKLKFFPINLSNIERYHVLNIEELYKSKLDKIPLFRDRLLPLNDFYKKRNDRKSIFLDTSEKIWNLDHLLQLGLNEYKKYFYIGNNRFLYQFNRIFSFDLIICIIKENLDTMEKVMNENSKLKYQKFCPLDPYGEEIWDD